MLEARARRYGKLAELCHQRLKNGREVYLRGSIRVREYEPTEGGRLLRPEIVASRVQSVGSSPPAAVGEQTTGEPPASADSETPVLSSLRELSTP